MCGGTSMCQVDCYWADGLSPRVRGNRPIARIEKRFDGSIPACAGEPTANLARTCGDKVYPRVCGGTSFVPRSRMRVMGLSPRVRGNPRQWLDRVYFERSIPACAGEPFRAT